MGVSSRTVWRVISENTAIMRSTPIPEAGEIWAYDNVNIMVNVQLLRQAHSAKMIDTRKSNRQRDRIMKPECYKFVGPVDRSDQMVCYLSVRRRTLKRPCGDGEGVAGEGWASGCGVQPHPDVCPMTDISMNQRARVIQPVLTLVLSKCRDTLYVESFNNACLQYLDKRIFSGSTKYSLRMYLAILDWSYCLSMADQQPVAVFSPFDRNVAKYYSSSRNPKDLTVREFIEEMRSAGYAPVGGVAKREMMQLDAAVRDDVDQVCGRQTCVQPTRP
ncbi:hypothetical protein Bbelb_318480 [Branchiostoma belcheri]|nr:hypothetical protein Bbelb_318480 [Branchiostoma belcheri]